MAVNHEVASSNLAGGAIKYTMIDMAKGKQKQSVARSRKKEMPLWLPFVIGAVIVLIITGGIYMAKKTTTANKNANDIFLKEGDTLAVFNTLAASDVELAQDGFVSGHVEKKTRDGEGAIQLPTLIGAYTFKDAKSAKKFYDEIITKDPFFSNESAVLSNPTIDAIQALPSTTCKAYAIKQSPAQGLPPADAIHILCQRDYAIVEVLTFTYRQDGVSVMSQIAYTMLKKVE